MKNRIRQMLLILTAAFTVMAMNAGAASAQYPPADDGVADDGAAADDGDVADDGVVTGTPVPTDGAAVTPGTGQLPFTGGEVTVLLAVAFGLLGAGLLVLRRREDAKVSANT